MIYELHSGESCTAYYSMNTLSFNFWANPCNQIHGLNNIHQTEYEHMSFPPSNCYIIAPTFVWVRADLVYSTRSRLSQDSESCTAQLNRVFTAVVNESLAGVIFILFTKPKQRKNNPLPTSTTSSVPGGLQPRQQNKEEYLKKKRCVENNSGI